MVRGGARGRGEVILGVQPQTEEKEWSTNLFRKGQRLLQGDGGNVNYHMWRTHCLFRHVTPDDITHASPIELPIHISFPAHYVQLCLHF